jgi:hypothetical protein
MSEKLLLIGEKEVRTEERFGLNFKNIGTVPCHN